MKTDVARLMSPVAVIAALAWAVPCLSQDLNINIAVPEPVTSSGEGKDAGKRKPTQRSESPQGARRNARPRPGEAPPALDLTKIESELQGRQGRVSEEPTLAPPKNRSPRPWATAAAGNDSKSEPGWTNPAGIPLRQKPTAEAAPRSPAHDKQPAAKASSAAKTSKNRGEGAKGVSGHNGWLTRWFQPGRREAQKDESPPIVARRNRVPTSDHRQAPLAPPSPWSNGRELEVDRE